MAWVAEITDIREEDGDRTVFTVRVSELHGPRSFDTEWLFSPDVSAYALNPRSNQYPDTALFLGLRTGMGEHVKSGTAQIGVNPLVQRLPEP